MRREMGLKDSDLRPLEQRGGTHGPRGPLLRWRFAAAPDLRGAAS
jgi:hypothetical protein